MRWARQRWRSERGKQDSIALMIPGAPSEASSSGIAQTAAAHVLEEGGGRLGVFLGAGHQREQFFPTIGREAPGGQHRLAPLSRPDPLGDAVDVEIDDVVLA
jgi:hypothetical protein